MNATLLTVLLALTLDRLLGDPRRWHPVAGVGRWAQAVEARLNGSGNHQIWWGALAVVAVLAPVLLTVLFVAWLIPVEWSWLFAALVLWCCLGLRSLSEHAMAVHHALGQNDLTAARGAIAMMVSRDTTALDEEGVATAATESVLENGADAVFASLFWFVLAGLPGVVVHRVVNTLDAMWGYRTPRFDCFGRVAARLDDALNWIPARLTALTYAVLGHTRSALQCWRSQAPHWDSPNAGPVMAAGAGALGVRLGGPAPYAGGWKQRPVLGAGEPAPAAAIEASVRLVRHGVLVWLLVLVIGLGLAWGLS